MAAPVVANVATGTYPADASPATVTLSCGSPSAGDLLVGFFTSGASTARKVNVPSGWTSAFDQNVSLSVVVCCQVIYKVADGSETTQVFSAPIAFGSIAGALLRITGAADPAVTAFGVSSLSTNTSGTYTFPDATAPADDSLCFSAGAGVENDGGESTTFPGGETSVANILSPFQLSLSTFSHAAGSVGTRSGAYTPSYRSRASYTVCMAPSASAAGQPAGKRMGGVQFVNRNQGVW